MKAIPGFSEFLSDLPFGAPGRRCALRGCGPSGNRTQWGLRHAVEPQTQTQQLAMSCSQKNIQTSRTKSNKVLWCSLWVRKTHIVVFLLTGQTFLILYTLWKSLSFAWFQSCSWTVFVSLLSLPRWLLVFASPPPFLDRSGSTALYGMLRLLWSCLMRIADSAATDSSELQHCVVWDPFFGSPLGSWIKS